MRKAFLIVICACVMGLAADAPYAGKWKMNPAKSNFGESTVTFEQMPGGQIKMTMDGQSYTFKLDAKDTMTPWGTTNAWKAVDTKTWETTEKINGKVMSTSMTKLSGDGKTLTIDSKRVKPDGGTSNDSMTLDRVSGGPGLAGKWKTKKLTSSSPESLSLTPRGNDGLTISIGDGGGVCDAKFDGKDYPATGTLWPAGWTCAVAKKGSNAIDLTWKREGKEMYKSTLTAAADGKSLTETGSAAGINEKFTVVYERQ